MNALLKGPYGQLRNYFLASFKLKSHKKIDGKTRRIYDEAQTPLARVLASAEVSAATKEALRHKKAGANPFALKLAVNKHMKEIEAMRRRCLAPAYLI
jgi:hypothetical protein